MTKVLDLTREWARDRRTYCLPASCDNCGWVGEVRLNRGYKRPGGGLGQRPATCPDCGCSSVIAHRREFE